MSLFSSFIALLKSDYPSFVSFDLVGKTLQLETEEINQLINEAAIQGYPIQIKQDACRLTLPLVNKESVAQNLQSSAIGRSLEFFDKIDSTNTYALDNIQDLTHGTVILTDHQYRGKGRLGRSWHADLGKSVALTIVLKPKFDSQQAVLLTQLTAAALVKSLEPDWSASIKWPNDVLIDSRKAAGILVESHFSGSELAGIVIGTGINTNLSREELPEDLKSKATSLAIEKNNVIDPNLIITSFLSWFDTFYTAWSESMDASPFISVCREKSGLIGKEIAVHHDQTSKSARVIDISNEGELVIRYRDTNEIDHLNSLNFSVRGQSGYL
ncbi:MAG: biotin--[acetyl-CoA-carboxylase] ligase [Alkalibacterium thalassium]|nr:biotin--[acetyl-CoA-carboxylase] ligase [Alkalibacterium thalassium]